MSVKIDWDAPGRFVETADNPTPAGADVGFLKARDGVLLRNAVFMPDNPRGTVVLMTGYSEFIEKYFETISDLLAMGWAVAMPEWRAHGLSDGRGRESTRLFIKDFDINLRDLEDRWERLVTPLPAPHVGLAHSMGGLISLRFAQAHPDRFAALAQCAPMLGINIPAPAMALIKTVASVYALLGQADSWNPFDPPTTRPADPARNRITSDAARYKRGEDLYLAEHTLQVNGRSIGWLHAAAKAMADSARPAFLQSVRVPLFIGSAADDALVDNAAHEAALAHVPGAQGKLYAHAMHELMMEKDATRQAFLADVDGFFAAAAG